MNTQRVVVLGFTPSFLVMAYQVWRVHALFLSGSSSQQLHLNWLTITFIYLVCWSLETGNKNCVTSSDQRIIDFFNQLGNKNQTKRDFSHSHFPRLLFSSPWRGLAQLLISRAFHRLHVFPRLAQVAWFPAISRVVWMKSMKILTTGRARLWMGRNTCECSVFLFGTVVKHD